MLTPEQLEKRRKGVGSSDARRIMAGEWYDLWLEKTSRIVPPPILSPWDALLRHHIEPAIMDFWEVTHDCKVELRGAAVGSETHPIIRATLDGYWVGDARVIDAKLLNQFTPDKANWAIDKYGWQMVHQMCAAGCAKGSLYISIGMAKPVRMDWERDDWQEQIYIDRCREFWAYVEADKEPPGGPPPVEAPLPVEAMRTVDMTGDNQWGAFAADWLEYRDEARCFDTAAKGLRGLVAKDVGRAYGNGIEITRDGRGLTIKRLDEQA